MYTIVTTRFTHTTWESNQQYRAKNNITGCIYGSPQEMSPKILNDSIVFVVEMNNDSNTIEGIGLVRNRAYLDKYYNIYKEGNYNRFVYVGKTRISRCDMTEEEEEVMKVFDILCFKGNKHMKRGHGLKSFPIEILYKCSKRLNLVNFISEMFKKRLIQKTEKNINEII